MDEGRDVEILFPLIFHAEKYLNADVEFAFIYNVHEIYRKKPDLVLLANAIGSRLHFLITKYAYDNHIQVFTLISEGNFRTNGTFNYWGYNTDKILYQDFVCHWSKRTFDFLCKELPLEKNKMVITGALGFDRYKIYSFFSKEEFLNNHELSRFKKVIVYAGWAFGKIFNKTGLIEIKNSSKEDPEGRINWMKNQMLSVENILRETIEKNPDTLFILKRHPNEIHPHLRQPDRNEMVNLKNYPNVIYTIDARIHDLISIADIFTGFETTTALETWVLKNNPTILINPDENFKRDELYKGSIIAHNYQEFQNYINEYYETGTILAFNDDAIISERKKLIYNTIGFADGMNHIRAGYYLSKTLHKIDFRLKHKVLFNLKYFTWFYLAKTGKIFYSKQIFEQLPKFKKTIWIFDNLALKKLSVLKDKYYLFLEKFHQEHQIPEKLNDTDFINQLLKTSESEN